MASFNKVVLVGNLTSDPELTYTPKGAGKTKFSIAINRKYKDAEGAVQEDITFVPITTWGKQAESCSQYLHKGSPVLIEGRLRITPYETEQGEKRKYAEVVAQSVQFLSSSKREEGDKEPDREPDSGHNDEVPF